MSEDSDRMEATPKEVCDGDARDHHGDIEVTDRHGDAGGAEQSKALDPEVDDMGKEEALSPCLEDSAVGEEKMSSSKKRRMRRKKRKSEEERERRENAAGDGGKEEEMLASPELRPVQPKERPESGNKKRNKKGKRKSGANQEEKQETKELLGEELSGQEKTKPAPKQGKRRDFVRDLMGDGSMEDRNTKTKSPRQRNRKKNHSGEGLLPTEGATAGGEHSGNKNRKSPRNRNNSNSDRGPQSGQGHVSAGADGQHRYYYNRPQSPAYKRQYSYPGEGQRSGSPYNRSGSPYERSGSPYERSGSPYNRSGSPYNRSGSPYQRSHSQYDYPASPYDKLKMGYGSPQDMPKSPYQGQGHNRGHGHHGRGRGLHGNQGGQGHHGGYGGQERQRTTSGQNQDGSSRGKGRRGHHSNRQKKHTAYDAYWPQEMVSDAIKKERLIQGALRINPKNFEDAYIPHPDGRSDVYIGGLHDRNRALNGDIVAVLLYPREEWKVMMDDLEGESAALADTFKQLNLNSPKPGNLLPGQTDPSSTEVPPGAEMHTPVKQPGTPVNQPGTPVDQPGTPVDQQVTPVNTPGDSSRKQSKSTARKKYMVLKDLVSSPLEGASNAVRRLFVDTDDGGKGVKSDRNEPKEQELQKSKMDAVPDKLLLRTGKVVFITEKKHSRACTGHIRLMNDKNPDLAFFAPIDHRMPRMFIPMQDCPLGFYQRPDDHSSTLFIARLTEWEETSQFAKGCLARSLGEAGEIEPETEGMLIEYGVDYAEFSPQAVDCLPKDLPWSIPASEFEYRRDLRKECIFTIDPATARDLDDALHCNYLGDGLYEVGVHIADVSYFVKEETALDTVAADRATSVYLVQKVIPMLPRLLCEKLCSLNPDEDRLTFSVIWKMTEQGDIIEEWFGRSVIRSCVKLSYDHAQGIIEQPERSWTSQELPPISEGFSVPQIKERVLNLHKIAQQMRKKRFESGALRLDQVKLSYSLDKETGLPNGYYVYVQKESNKLVEEFMLLANMATAHKIYKTYPELAVLRRHPSPQTRMVDDLVETCRSLGVDIDATSAGTLQRSIARFCGTSSLDLAKVQILTVLCSKPMQNAKYFCTGCLDDEVMYRHYALNVPLYTHFTSPIRRYPDIMVHRLLAGALGYCEPPSLAKGQIQREAEHCNDKKTNSKRVQELSSELFFAVFVKACGPLEERGMVMAVLDKSFDVLVLKLGVVKRIYCEKLPLKNYSYRKDHKKPELTLIWESCQGHPQEVKQVITIFSQVNCILSDDEQPLKWKAIIKHPEDPVADSDEDQDEDDVVIVTDDQ